MLTETIYSGRHYEVHYINSPTGGLVVTRKRGRGGVQLRPDHPQCAEYLNAFRTAIDDDESHALCRALLGP